MQDIKMELIILDVISLLINQFFRDSYIFLYLGIILSQLYSDLIKFKEFFLINFKFLGLLINSLRPAIIEFNSFLTIIPEL